MHNSDFIEVTSGIDPGEEVILKMPDDYEPPKFQIADQTKKKQADSKTAAKDAESQPKSLKNA